ncbi:trichothecene 3-o-acetyltransferase [Phyllosticta citribraziliensis]|uniref:Trichothecene 3-o-acetyltransferase n=1 Tax=Phyllosticta citribraziliensis TaxID=989973 RepID=A0ABR1M6N4_9PEZI
MARKTVLRVSSSNPANEPGREDFPLSDFDHTLPKIYTQVTLTFKLEDDVDRQAVIENLIVGLQRTLSQYRSLRGTLQTDVATGKLWIRKEKHSTVEFIVNWMEGTEDDFPSFEALENKDFPAAMLDGDSLLPLHVTHKAPLTPLGESGDDNNPILVVQANIIRGGLILAVAVHHSCSDGPGMNGFLSQWAENTRCVLTGATPTPFDPVVLDRSPLTSKDSARKSVVNDVNEAPFSFTVAKTPPAPPQDFKMPRLSQVMLHFPADRLARLREDANPPGQSGASSYDAIVAILWRCMTRARVPLLRPERSAESRLLHAVGLRQFMKPPLPARFLGNALALPTPSMEIGTLLDDGALPQIASVIRASIQEATSKDSIKKTADWIASVPNKSCITLTTKNFLGLDIAGASWRRMTPYQEHDFGFGFPKALRWPKPMVDGYFFIYPHRPKDDPREGVELNVCLEASCMKRLLADEELAQYAHPRGI